MRATPKKYSSFWFGGLYSPITNHFQVRNVISRKIISKLESISSVVSSLCKVYFHTRKIIDLHQNCFCLCDMFYIHLLRTANSENCDQFSSQQGRLIRRNDSSECFYYKVLWLLLIPLYPLKQACNAFQWIWDNYASLKRNVICFKPRFFTFSLIEILLNFAGVFIFHWLLC